MPIFILFNLPDIVLVFPRRRKKSPRSCAPCSLALVFSFLERSFKGRRPPLAKFTTSDRVVEIEISDEHWRVVDFFPHRRGALSAIDDLLGECSGNPVSIFG
jgi:hypothetical protein